MALTFTNVIDGALRVWNVAPGLRMAQIDMVASDANGADYSSGFDLVSNAEKMGFRKIFGILGAEIRRSAGAQGAHIAIYDNITGKLRFYETGAALSGVLSEVAGADLTDGDIVRMVVIGV